MKIQSHMKTFIYRSLMELFERSSIFYRILQLPNGLIFEQ